MRPLLLLLLSLPLGACSAHSLRDAESLRPTLPALLPHHGEAKIESAWWRSFQDDTLNDLVEQALAHNLDLAASGQQLQQLRSLAGIQRAAKLPLIGASLSASFAPANAPVNPVTGQPIGGDDAELYSQSSQLGVSINAASEHASCPLDWRLFIPEEWDEPSEFNEDRRAKAHLPDDVCHVEKWRLALEMIDELRAWGLEPPVVLADGAYGDITDFRGGLEERELGYVLDVKGATSAYAEDVRPERPEWPGRGRPPAARRTLPPK